MKQKIILAIGLLCIASFKSCSKNDAKSQTPVGRYYPGQTVPDSVISEHGVEQFFSCQQIPDTIFTLMQGKTFKSNCTVPRDSLRYLLCLHKDINGVAKVGEMVVNKSIANTVLDIFRKLYDASYPIELMRLPDYWDADDERQMRNNNSSSFNFRFISHTHKMSRHGLGLAIDINPLYNPYYKKYDDGSEYIQPETAGPYIDRTKSFNYKIEKDDLCWTLFTQKGFEWGGSWTNRKDYQHFEIPE